MPRWTYRRVIRTGGGDPNPVTVKDDVARRGGKQLAEYMLCTSCEQRIGAWEDYVASIALQEDDSFPGRDRLQLIHDLTGEELVVGDASALDIPKIVRFAVSVVWRASVSTEMPKVDAGAATNELLARFLRGPETAGLPPTVYVIAETITPDPRLPIDEFCIAPYGGSVPSGEQSYAFAVFGMVFQVIVAAAEHASFREACIDRSRRMVMSDGAMLLPDIAATFAAVRARGALRRGRRARG